MIGRRHRLVDERLLVDRNECATMEGSKKHAQTDREQASMQSKILAPRASNLRDLTRLLVVSSREQEGAKLAHQNVIHRFIPRGL